MGILLSPIPNSSGLLLEISIVKLELRLHLYAGIITFGEKKFWKPYNKKDIWISILDTSHKWTQNHSPGGLSPETFYL